ncbi:DUF4365 domain-containing protein [Streptomyces sp. NBC_00243]|uniref:DUF4365 domain-containing protein n=1 Tax=Streptomyces sp. NBC_00243 TaxID=2975688 RepID=UPI002DD94748|nr:DUF4365 domain-containing protein [Streptomyces sp. NBC_00243]WRZ24350.1 DUF4365 domain-containing protein [Streptomyces sp. NBC_00243]
MRGSPQEQTGAIGANEVSGNFERINWGPVPNSMHDLGTDLLVQARDSRLFDRGLIVGVQVKGGPSWFGEPEVDPNNGDVIGWWYRDKDVDHFEDWVSHDLPHLLVLHDLETRVSYWVHVTGDIVASTGKGAKVLVPKRQTIDADHVDELLEVAASKRETVSYEGSVWSEGAAAIAPARRLRYALLAPRLIVPHRNASHEKVIDALEGIALLVDGRIRDLDIFTKKHREVLDPSEARSARSWLWRLYGDLYTVFSENSNDLMDRIGDAPSPADRAAVCVLAACLLLDAEKNQEAINLLTGEIEGDSAAPIDFAWLLTQRARMRVDIGDIALARGDAAEAQRYLVGTTDDITASVLKAATSSLLFETASWQNRNLKDVAVGNDTVISWWRSRYVSSGLTDYFDDSFLDWTDTAAGVNKFEDIANNRLFAAMLSAHFSGEHGVWRATGSLLARHTLMDERNVDGQDRTASALDDLRRSGDASSVEKALRYLRRTGPIGALVESVAAVGVDNWTHTTARTNLAFWENCGDLLTEDAADAALHFSLDVIRDDSAFASRVNPTFKIGYYMPRAIRRLLSGCSDSAHREVVTLLAEAPDVTDDLQVMGYSHMLEGLRKQAIGDQVSQGALRSALSRQSDPRMTAELLSVLASWNVDCKSELLARVRQGDIHALFAIGDIESLDEAGARACAGYFRPMVEKSIEDAQNSSYGIHSVDPAGALALISVYHPECADWELIERFLREVKMPGSYKRKTFLNVANGVSRLAPEIVAKMRNVALWLDSSSSPKDFAGAPLGASAVYLAAVSGGYSNETLTDTIGRLVNGSTQERMDAAGIMSHLRHSDFSLALVSLLGDSDPLVQQAAASALANWVGECGEEAPAVVQNAFGRTLEADGVQTPLAIARGIRYSTMSPIRAVEVLVPLQSHPSALVRFEVAQASSAS